MTQSAEPKSAEPKSAEPLSAKREPLDAAALERAQAKTQSRSDFGDFSGDPSQRRARSKKRDYAGMSDRSFMKLIQGGASVGYEPVGADDGAMRVRLKKKRP